MSFNNSDSQDSYIIDDPVDTKDEDRLERYPIAERIVKTIVSRKDKSSFVLGIYGAWGEGKSTVLNFVDNIFDREYKSSVCCIKFNPWYFRDEDQLLSNFFELLADKLDGGIILNRERMGKYSKDYLAKLIPPTTLKLVGVDLGEMFNRWGGLLSDVSLDERKKNLEQFLECEKKKIVIIIDDVDRLDKNEIQTVLKLVKLLANFKHTTYILAFDDNVVAAAIGDSYSGNKDLGKDLGKGFLEKIVQVPIPLPKLSRDSLKSF
jgi:predicted KAP-like P-loop ATPase